MIFISIKIVLIFFFKKNSLSRNGDHESEQNWRINYDNEYYVNFGCIITIFKTWPYGKLKISIGLNINTC